MKVIVAGCRHYDDYDYVEKILDHYLSAKAKVEEIEIVSGRCDRGIKTLTTDTGIDVFGADGLGELYAKNRGYKVTPFQADWAHLGKFAGPVRNAKMAFYCKPKQDALICFWDGHTRGTKDMINKATEAGLIVKTVIFKKETI